MAAALALALTIVHWWWMRPSAALHCLSLSITLSLSPLLFPSVVVLSPCLFLFHSLSLASSLAVAEAAEKHRAATTTSSAAMAIAIAAAVMAGQQQGQRTSQSAQSNLQIAFIISSCLCLSFVVCLVLLFACPIRCNSRFCSSSCCSSSSELNLSSCLCLPCCMFDVFIRANVASGQWYLLAGSCCW